MAKVKLESRKASTLAYITHKGPYDKVPWSDYIEKLYGFAKEKKVMPGFYPMATYINSPDCTPADERISEISITVKGDVEGKGDIKIKKLPDMKVATISHKGPGSEFATTYAKLFAWVAENGYEVAGPPMEIYSKKPEVKGDQTILYAKVMVPVKRK
jgi:effector-binding domain-containing protein